VTLSLKPQFSSPVESTSQIVLPLASRTRTPNINGRFVSRSDFWMMAGSPAHPQPLRPKHRWPNSGFLSAVGQVFERSRFAQKRDSWRLVFELTASHASTGDALISMTYGATKVSGRASSGEQSIFSTPARAVFEIRRIKLLQVPRLEDADPASPTWARRYPLSKSIMKPQGLEFRPLPLRAGDTSQENGGATRIVRCAPCD
jgi:hypothetical protein